MGEEMLLVNVVTDLSMLLQLGLYAPFPAAALDEVGTLKKKVAIEMQGLRTAQLRRRSPHKRVRYGRRSSLTSRYCRAAR